MPTPLVVGAVAYSPKVVPIWEGIRDYFRDAPQPMDFVLFSNYERQVQYVLDGAVDVAWNTNLAWVRLVRETAGTCVALAMRDTDVGYRTLLVARPESGLAGPRDLEGRRLALGSRDSAQAAILPPHFLEREGVDLGRVTTIRFDSDVGKHGDTGTSELDAMEAVLARRADAAAVGVSTWEALTLAERLTGHLEPFWWSPPYCHCNFSALGGLDEGRREAWTAHLLAMDWDDRAPADPRDGGAAPVGPPRARGLRRAVRGHRGAGRRAAGGGMTGAIAVLRIFFGAVFLSNGLAKLVPGIAHLPGGYYLIDGETAKRILEHNARSHPVQLYHDLVFNVFLPNWNVVGPAVGVTETVAGALLVLGLFTWAGALLAAALSLHVQFSDATGPWLYEYAVEWVPLLCLVFMRAGRTFGIDGLRRGARPG